MRIDYLSATRLKLFEECPARYRAVYDRAEPLRSDEPYLRLGTAVHWALEHYYRGAGDVATLWPEAVAHAGLTRLDLVRQGQAMVELYVQQNPREVVPVVGQEVSIDALILGGMACRGSIDRVDRVAPGVYRVIDYKTSYLPLSEEEAQTDLQLLMYDWAVRQLYPDANQVVLSLDYLRLNHSVMVQHTAAELQQFVQYVTWLGQYIRDLPGEKAPAMLNRHCHTCPVRSSCDKFSAIFTVRDAFELDPMDLDAVADEAQAISTQIALLEKQRNALLDHLLQYMNTLEVRRYEAPSVTYVLDSGLREDLRPQAVYDLLGPERFWEVAKIAKGELEKVATKQELAALRAQGVPRPQKPFLRPYPKKKSAVQAGS